MMSWVYSKFCLLSHERGKLGGCVCVHVDFKSMVHALSSRLLHYGCSNAMLCASRCSPFFNREVLCV